MPDAIAEAPPAQSQSATGGSATFDFAQQMAASVAKEVAGTPEPPAEPAAQPETTPEPVKETPKEAATTEPAKETKPAASEKPMSEWTDKDFDAAMKKAPSKAWKVYEFAKSKYEARVKELEGKIKTVEAKPVEAPGILPLAGSRVMTVTY